MSSHSTCWRALGAALSRGIAIPERADRRPVIVVCEQGYASEPARRGPLLDSASSSRPYLDGVSSVARGRLPVVPRGTCRRPNGNRPTDGARATTDVELGRSTISRTFSTATSRRRIPSAIARCPLASSKSRNNNTSPKKADVPQVVGERGMPNIVGGELDRGRRAPTRRTTDASSPLNRPRRKCAGNTRFES